jgi:hypothetical protein
LKEVLLIAECASSWFSFEGYCCVTENIPRALKNACSGCNNSQKYFVRKMALYVMKNRPSEWLEVARKYNPTGEHQEVFHRFLAEGR